MTSRVNILSRMRAVLHRRPWPSIKTSARPRKRRLGRDTAGRTGSHSQSPGGALYILAYDRQRILGGLP